MIHDDSSALAEIYHGHTILIKLYVEFLLEGSKQTFIWIVDKREARASSKDISSFCGR